ncbi:MAG: RluA family pseudouridine synthase [Lachnospiraceae bacterium]|nr:RluA family pseudouridine synthase [Lachnospiraceae bacterium]
MTETTFLVEEEYEGERLDKYLSAVMEDLSRSYIQKLWKQNAVTLNGKAVKASTRLAAGDVVWLQIPEATVPEILPEKMDLDIVYEDSDVILVNKPKGMVVHPAPGHYTGTLVNGLMEHCTDLSGINGSLRPGIVHRIDMDTTGILIACKNDRAHNCIALQLKEHSITREYRALVYGNIEEDSGTVDKPIGRNPSDRKKMAIVPDGRHAVTHYRVLERFGDCTWIACRLETGRTHQIRVHMSSIGHPLVGDQMYGPASGKLAGIGVAGLQGQCLHAGILGFVHPSTGAYMEFEAPLPAYLENMLEKLRKRV